MVDRGAGSKEAEQCLIFTVSLWPKHFLEWDTLGIDGPCHYL